LQFDFLAVHFDGTYFEVYADRGYERGVESVLAETEQHARFPDAGVADQQQFEQIVVRLGHRVT
jgi:hypothetical protein